MSLDRIIVTSLAEYSAAAAPPPDVGGTVSLTDLINGTDRFVALN